MYGTAQPLDLRARIQDPVGCGLPSAWRIHCGIGPRALHERQRPAPLDQGTSAQRCHVSTERSAPCITPASPAFIPLALPAPTPAAKGKRSGSSFARARYRWSSPGMRAQSRGMRAGPQPFSNDPHRCSLAGRSPAGHARRQRLCFGPCDRRIRCCPTAQCLSALRLSRCTAISSRAEASETSSWAPKEQALFLTEDPVLPAP